MMGVYFDVRDSTHRSNDLPWRVFLFNFLQTKGINKQVGLYSIFRHGIKVDFILNDISILIIFVLVVDRF